MIGVNAARAAAVAVDGATGGRFGALAGTLAGAIFGALADASLGAAAGASLEARFGAARVALPTGRRPDLAAFFALLRALLVVFLDVLAADLLERPAVLAECLLIVAI